MPDSDGIPCPDCHGTGQQDIYFLRKSDGTCDPHRRITCQRCRGTGQITQRDREWIEAGQAMRKERLSRGMTLRREAARRGLKPSTLSAMEQGRIFPVPSGRWGNR